MNVWIRTIVVLAILLGSACSGRSSDDTAHAVTIMAFNVENLFDNQDDPGKDDKAYLKLADKQSEAHKAECALIDVDRWREQCLSLDWHDALIEKKLSVVAETILQVDGGRGPDIVALQEIENVRILERLRRDYLQAAGYGPAILIEGEDARGIDVAFLSRLETVAGPTLHPLVLDEEFAGRAGDVRGVLQADFRLPDGEILTGFSVHFPAPFHPTAMRVSAYEHLNALQQSLPADRPVFAAGDFNTTSAEDLRESMLDQFVRPHWTVSNDLCGGCPGTQYYAPDDSWSFLDMILFRPGRGADATWQLRENSVAIANRHPPQVTAAGTPRRFALPGGDGVSDHWPVIVTIEPE